MVTRLEEGARAPKQAAQRAERDRRSGGASSGGGVSWSNLMARPNPPRLAPQAGSRPEARPAANPELLRKLSSPAPSTTQRASAFEKDLIDMQAARTARPDGDMAWTGNTRGGPNGAQAAEARAADEKREREQVALDARKHREDLLELTTGGLTSAGDLLHEMTQEKYNRLTPKQRAAVDFNTMLSDAVGKDMKRQVRYERTTSDQERATYDKAEQQMFGEDRGSDIYAPETMAVLRQLKLDDKTADLDDYLGLKVAITSKDLKDFVAPETVPNHDPTEAVSYDRDYLNLKEGYATKTQELADSLVKGKAMLQDFRTTAAAEVMASGDLARLGGLSTKAGQPGLGFEQPKLLDNGAPADLNTYFQQAFEQLATVDKKDRDDVLSVVGTELHPDEYQQFLNYSDARTRGAQQYGAEMVPGSTTTADEFRRILGLEK